MAQSYISLAGSVKLMSEDWYIAAFEGRVSRKGFRSLCESLCVPMLLIGDERFVDMSRFELALNFITRIGQPSFAFPGSRGAMKDFARSVDPDELRAALDEILPDVIRARTLSGARVGNAVQKAMRRAVDGMIESVYRQLSPRDRGTWNQRHKLRLAEGE